MSRLQPIRGTHDLLPEAMRQHRHVIDTARRVTEYFGFQEMATPVFEFTDVFRRTLGETSDVVTKEMYSFTTKGGESVTLRPEGTAGIARAVISNGLYQKMPMKLFYHGPMFRYERPQKGRQRQFHQIGVELLGAASPQADIETIAAAAMLLEKLGFGGKTALELNTLGDQGSRAAYRDALVAYFSEHRDALSEDSRIRLSANPLRILDSKDEDDRALIAGAPDFSDYLSTASRAFFVQVTQGLRGIGIPFEVNTRLVRGLDYYCHTAFEFTTQVLGAQGTVLAGGRYDGLIEQMGGPPTPGIGWAAGIERLAMLSAHATPAPRPVVMIPVGPQAEYRVLLLAHDLRREGLRVEQGYSGNLAKRMKRADKLNARAVVIIGEEELGTNSAVLRDLDSGEQETIPQSRLMARLTELMQADRSAR